MDLLIGLKRYTVLCVDVLVLLMTLFPLHVFDNNDYMVKKLPLLASDVLKMHYFLFMCSRI